MRNNTNKINVVFFDAKPYDIEEFKKYNNDNFQIKFLETKLTKDTFELAKGADVVCVFVNDDVNKYVIDKLYELDVKLIALRCAGYNNVDIEYCFNKIHVVHVPAYSPYAVAEHAMALLLTSIRRIHKAYNRTKDFNFSLNGLTGFELHNKTIGVVGTGKIGKIFIDICRGFGMKIIAYDKYPSVNNVEYVTFDEILLQSDIISFHCPLTPETHHIINTETIKKLKDGVVIINTSRGALIDSEAMLEGIKARKIGAACLDVYEEESDIFFNDFSGHIVDDDILARLISMPNVIVTSHQAFLTSEALKNIAETTINNIKDIIENNFSENELCYHCGNIEHCKKERKQRCF